MKKILFASALFLLFSCADNSQQSDNEKENANIEINTDSADIKIGEGGISVEGKDADDTMNIKINAKDGIKIEGKDGKVEINTGDSGGLKIEKKGKNVNIQIKEN